MQRHIEARNNCLRHMERGLRNAAKKDLLAPSVNPRLAAVSLHELVDGLIMNWVLDPKYMPLAREAKILVDQYLDQLRAAPHKRAPGSGAVRKAVWAPSRAISQFQPVCL